MLHIEKFTVNMIQENCYIVNDETLDAVIIDDGAFYPEEKQAIEQYIEQNHLRPVHLLNTHAHFDHVLGNRAIYDKYGLLTELHEADAYLLDSLHTQVREMMGWEMEEVQIPAGKFLTEQDEITFGSHKLRVIATPGHTPGGICFYCEQEQVLFSGDSLFQYSIGRTDFPGGNLMSLISSLKQKVLTLPDDTQVLSGHGPATTVGQEKSANLYLR